jgi:hypothetical protein
MNQLKRRLSIDVYPSKRWNSRINDAIGRIFFLIACTLVLSSHAKIISLDIQKKI